MVALGDAIDVVQREGANQVARQLLRRSCAARRGGTARGRGKRRPQRFGGVAVRAYRQLLADTVEWCAPAAGERWLDLGCGSGPLSAALWEKSNGSVAEVVGLDCAAVNEQAYAKLRRILTPPPGDRLRFDCHNFSDGLAKIPTDSFDHAVSGLSITYAESYSEAEGRWTTDAYDAVLAEVRRVIRPGGRFVFSVNVPEPSTWVLAASGLVGLLFARWRRFSDRK